MGENTDAFNILLTAQLDTSSIISQIEKIGKQKVKVDVDTSGYDNLKKKTSESIKLKVDTGDFNVKIKQIETGFNKIGQSSGALDKAKASYAELQRIIKSGGSSEDIASSMQRFSTALKTADNGLKIAKMDASGFASSLQTIKLSNKIQSWLKNNTAATKEARIAMQGYLNEIESSGGKLSKTDYRKHRFIRFTTCKCI